MKILVPLKRVSDPDNANKIKIAPGGSRILTDGLQEKLNPFDEYAVETALRLTENAKVRIPGDTVTIESVAIDPLNITDVDVRDNHQAVNVVLEPAQTTIIGVWITITPRSRAASNIIVDSVRVTLSYRTDTRGFLQTEIRSVGRTR